MRHGTALFLLEIACMWGLHADVLKKDGRIVSIGYGREDSGTIHFRLCTDERETSNDKPPFKLVKGNDCNRVVENVVPEWTIRLFGMECAESECRVVDRHIFEAALPALAGAEKVQLTRRDHVLTMSSGDGKAKVQY